MASHKIRWPYLSKGQMFKTVKILIVNIASTGQFITTAPKIFLPCLAE